MCPEIIEITAEPGRIDPTRIVTNITNRITVV
jgi:hypothetical protein